MKALTGLLAVAGLAVVTADAPAADYEAFTRSYVYTSTPYSTFARRPIRTAFARTLYQPPAGVPATPEAVPEPPPMPMPPVTPMPQADPMPNTGAAVVMEAPLFHNVVYDDLDNIHPCAVRTIVQVPDPCACDDPCKKRHRGLFGLFRHHDVDPCTCHRCVPCCEPVRMVSVMICTPPCECVDVRVKRDGRHIKYDYGKYEVEIKVGDGVVKVDYDD